jgi:radical SAM protein with 4Fe4S-binding SPASM domain
LNLQSHKKFKQKTTPILRIQQVVQPDNEHENGFYVKFWEDIADQVSQVEYLPYYDIEPQPVVMEDWACPQLWQRLFVLVDGSVQPCCFLYADKVGNVNLQSIEEIWNGEKMNRFRRLHKEGKSHEIPMCASCYMRKHEYKKAEIKKI